MVALRLIPCLDVARGRVVKGVNFVGLRDAGDPVELACRYSQAGADELVFLDIAASHEGRGTLIDMVRRTAEAVTIPFTVGGGISTVDGITELLRAGADKVSLNSSAVRRPELVQEGAQRFGCQCIVVAIDARQRDSGDGWDVYVKGGRENTGLDVITGYIQADALFSVFVDQPPAQQSAVMRFEYSAVDFPADQNLCMASQ